SLCVAKNDVLRREAQRLHQLDAGDAGGAGTVTHQLCSGHIAASEVECIDEPSYGDDGGPVLVVMEDRYVHQFAQALLYDEAVRRPDVFQVYPAEGRPEVAHTVHESVDVLRVDFQVYGVD